MCFYDQYAFACGDWKWGNFKQHCSKEYRMGETCGMKLVMETHHMEQKCKWCERSDTKMRKRQNEVERIERWQREGKNPASVDKAIQEVHRLDTEIRAINAEITKRRTNFGSQRAATSSYDYAQYPQGYGY